MFLLGILAPVRYPDAFFAISYAQGVCVHQKQIRSQKRNTWAKNTVGAKESREKIRSQKRNT
jgi:hypothetical protein